MRLRSKVLFLTGLCTAFLLGYGGMAVAYPAGNIYGRAEYRGYFLNGLDTAGTYVLPQGCTNCNSGEAIRSTVSGNVEDFINFIKYTNLDIDNSGTTVQKRTGAQFIIQTMLLGTSYVKPQPVANDPYLVKWEEDVRYASGRGWITWRTNFSYTLNSYYQGGSGGTTPADDAYYDDTGTASAIIFRDGTGKIVYVLKWACANPVGNSTQGNGGIPTAPPNFTMSGQVVPNPTSAYADTDVTFTHNLINTGTETSTTINWTAEDRTTGPTFGTIRNSGNTTVTAGQTKPVWPETYHIPAGTAAGTQICRRINFNPLNGSGGSGSSTPDACITVLGNYNLVPTVNFEILDSSGASKSTTVAVAEPTDTIVFKYQVNNTTAATSAFVSCKIYSLQPTGHYTQPAPPAYDAPAPGSDCSRTFPSGISDLPDQSVPTAGLFNTTVCRSLEINPAVPGGGAKGDEQCILIQSKPYFRVFSGDVIAGGGVSTADDVCTTNNKAAIIGWNKGSAPSNYEGAGVQYAAYALSRIFDVATSMGNGAGAAVVPTGLSFANDDVDVVTGDFGGEFGSVPCIRDHYADKPTSTSPVPNNVGLMSDGSYSPAADNVQIQIDGGVVNPDNRISVFVDGDVFIGGSINSITYSGSGAWTSSSIPSFRLIVRGNIYIDNDITQLDGLYVAQPKADGTKGIIYTCARLIEPYLPMVPSRIDVLANQCDNTKLTVNGAFVAKQVQLLRTVGTLAQSNSGETAASATIAEIFNYNPMLWIAQPDNEQSIADYDAINGLPPVL